MGLKPGYQQTEVGAIPSEWKVEKFCDITRLITCGVAATPVYVNEQNGKAFLSAQNVRDGKVVYDKHRFISRKLFSEITRHHKPQRGDILYTRVGAGIGEAAVIEDDYEFGIYVSLTLIKVDPKTIHSRFISHLLNSERYRSLAKNGQFAGGGVQNLNVEVVRGFLIPVPLLAEQIAIAEVLSDTDLYIQSLEQLINKRCEVKQGLMQELLTGRKRLSAFSSRWKVRQVGPLISPLKKTNRPASAGQIDGAYPFFTNSTKPVDKFIEEFDFDTEAIIANTGGEAFFDYFKGAFAVMSDCFVFESTDSTKFLYFMLKSIERFINENAFTGSGIKHLDKRFLLGTELSIPSEVEEQRAISTILSDMDANINAMKANLAKARQIKLGMMQELLTGRIRLACKPEKATTA